MHARPLALLGLAGLLSLRLPAAEIAAEGITLPFVDAKGRRTQVLRAQRGTMQGPLQTLSGVELIFFSPEEKDLIVQRVEAESAVWDTAKETLTSDRQVVVRTDFNRLSGEGFDFDFATSLLRIHRAFTLENSEVKLTSDRATVELATVRTSGSVRVNDILRCEAQGNLIVSVLPTARKKYLCDQAFSDRAIYYGMTRMIELPEPTRTLKRGNEGHIGYFKFDLRQPAPLAK
jgi:hypothetical protein